MRSILGLCLLVCFSFTVNGLPQESDSSSEPSHYISDDLFIFLHTGPGRQYRIIGSISAGMPVTKTDKAEANDYVEIIDSDGRIGWIEAQFLSNELSRRLVVEQLREQAADAQASVAPLRQRMSQANQTITSLEQEKKTLSAQLRDAQQTITSLNQSLENQQTAEQMQWLVKGGALVAGGLLLGIIVTYLPKRRKRNDEWMN